MKNQFTKNLKLALILVAIIVWIILLTKSTFGAILILLAGILIYPKTLKLLSDYFPMFKQKSVRIFTPTVLIIIGLVVIGKSSPKSDEMAIITKDNISEIKPKIINLDNEYYDANGDLVLPNENDITYRVLEVLKHDKQEGRIEEGSHEIIYLLLEPKSYDSEQLKILVKKLKSDYAKFKPDNCLLELWDNKEAYQKYLERDKYIGDSFDKLMEEFKRTRKPIGDKHKNLKENWDKKNYVFIADHNLGYLDFSGSYSYYPLQDDYYKAMGGENYKK